MSANYKQSNYVPELVDSTITYEDIATFPRPGCTAPDSIFFSLDDSVVTVSREHDSDSSNDMALYIAHTIHINYFSKADNDVHVAQPAHVSHWFFFGVFSP